MTRRRRSARPPRRRRSESAGDPIFEEFARTPWDRMAQGRAAARTYQLVASDRRTRNGCLGTLLLGIGLTVAVMTLGGAFESLELDPTLRTLLLLALAALLPWLGLRLVTSFLRR